MKKCKKCGGTIHGADCLLCEMFASGGVPKGHHPALWPMPPVDSLGVHPSQVKEAMERNKKAGVSGVSYAKDGSVIFADRGARRDLMRVHGVHDRRGGYGDDHATTEFTDSGDD